MTIDTIDIGDTVLCDLCNADFTDKSDTGGFVFESKAVCPNCTPDFLRSVRDNHELEYVRAICPEGMPFREFILRYRNGNNTISVLAGDDALTALGLARNKPS